MATLYVKHAEAAEAIARLAARLGISKAEAVLRSATAYEANLDRGERNPDAPEWLKQFWRDHPLPAPTGLRADKTFFDSLGGDM